LTSALTCIISGCSATSSVPTSVPGGCGA
jgi:hypothetical protein